MGSDLSSQRRTAAPKQQPRAGGGGTPHLLSKDPSIDSQAESQQQHYEPSGLSKPIGTSTTHSNNLESGAQSSTPGVNQQNRQQISLPKEIVIVSRGETEEDTKRFTFPPPFKPLIPIGHETLLPSLPQIDSSLLIDIGCLFQRELNKKATFVSSQQNTLCLIIKDIETYSIFLNVNVLTERNKRFVKSVDNFSKLSDIEILISKIDQDLDLCISRLSLLNDSLPEAFKLPDSPLDQDNNLVSLAVQSGRELRPNEDRQEDQHI